MAPSKSWCPPIALGALSRQWDRQSVVDLGVPGLVWPVSLSQALLLPGPQPGGGLLSVPLVETDPVPDTAQQVMSPAPWLFFSHLWANKS